MELEQKKEIIIIGAGETAQIAYEYFTYDSDYDVVAFAVNERFLDGEKDSLYGLPIYPVETIETQFPVEKFGAYVALGSGRLNRDRSQMCDVMRSKGFKLVNYVSSKAFVWRNVRLGDNCFIFENNVLQHNVVVGNNVTLWSGNHIGHGCVIGDNCFISSHVVVSGFCIVGANSFIGVNSSVADYIKIGKDNFIGIASVVNRDTDDGKIYRGHPIKESKISCRRYFKFDN